MDDYESRKNKLIEEALEAEEYFTLDELEEFAESLRKKNAEKLNSQVRDNGK